MGTKKTRKFKLISNSLIPAFKNALNKKLKVNNQEKMCKN
jgi:hypothetical protein